MDFEFQPRDFGRRLLLAPEGEPERAPVMRVRWILAGLLPFLPLAACADPEPARVEAESPGTTSRAASGAATDEPSGCSWRTAYDGARTGDHSGSYVIHLYDGRGESRQTRQIAFQKEGVLGLTLAFGEEPLLPGWTGSREMGRTDTDGRLALHLGEEFPWQNAMTGERRPFTVHITRNDGQTIEGSFEGSLLNVPRRPEVDLGDIEVEGEFSWTMGECRREP